MARTWDEKNKDLQIKVEKAEVADAAYRAGIEAGAKALQIAGATGQGGSPGQSYQRPLQNPDPGEAVFGVGKDGQTFFEFLKAMGIYFPTRVPKKDPNAGKPPFDDKGNELSAPVPGHSDWAGTNKGMTIAHTPHTPESTYDDDGRPEKVPRFKGGSPGGKLIDIDWMKEEYQKKHPKLEQLHNDKYHQANASSEQIRSKIKPLTKGLRDYDKSGGGRNPAVPAELFIRRLKEAIG